MDPVNVRPYPKACYTGDGSIKEKVPLRDVRQETNKLRFSVVDRDADG